MNRERTNTVNVDELRNAFHQFSEAYDNVTECIRKGFMKKINEAIKEENYWKVRNRCDDLTALIKRSEDLGIHLDNLIRLYSYDKDDDDLMKFFSKIFNSNSWSTDQICARVMCIEHKLIAASKYEE